MSGVGHGRTCPGDASTLAPVEVGGASAGCWALMGRGEHVEQPLRRHEEKWEMTERAGTLRLAVVRTAGDVVVVQIVDGREDETDREPWEQLWGRYSWRRMQYQADLVVCRIVPVLSLCLLTVLFEGKEDVWA